MKQQRNKVCDVPQRSNHQRNRNRVTLSLVAFCAGVFVVASLIHIVDLTTDVHPSDGARVALERGANDGIITALTAGNMRFTSITTRSLVVDDGTDDKDEGPNNNSATSNSTKHHHRSKHPNDDYSAYSCEHLTKYTGAHHNRTKQCAYARTCNDGDGIFFPSVYCSESGYSTRTLSLFYSPLIVLILVVLFRMVASTSEDYFSPALEMFSYRMGLPPRFAGVTLLALGNGAPDVAATVNAIRADLKIGYLMSLGELTGSGMFIGTVIAGVVVVVANRGGSIVACRGSLVRDVVMFLVTLAVVYNEFDLRRVVDVGSIRMFFFLYLAYVLLVMISDLYHKRVVAPRVERLLEEERRRAEEGSPLQLHGDWSKDSDVDGVEGSSLIVPAAAAAADERTGLLAVRQGRRFYWRISSSMCGAEQEPHHRLVITNPLEHLVEAISNYAEDEAFPPQQASREEASAAENGSQSGGDSESGISRHLPGRPYRSGWGERAEDGTEPLIVVHPHHGGVTNLLSPSKTKRRENQSSQRFFDATSTIESEEVDKNISEDWKSALREEKEELTAYCTEFWGEIYHNDEVNLIEKFLLTCELPFTVFRKLTVAIPCDDYYCRPLVGLSVMLSPLWLWVYFEDEYSINIFTIDYGYLAIIVPVLIGLLVLRYAPRGDGLMAPWASVPLALYGFVVAATWIDLIADKLVDVLSFVGIICQIPAPIMGLTVLAVGNSIGDLSANVAVAGKGLSDMAITACFAGPVFNMLVGLGLGFYALLKMTHMNHVDVILTPPLRAGFLFSMVNCVLIVVSGVCVGKGTLRKEYGYAALTLYIAYAATSLLV